MESFSENLIEHGEYWDNPGFYKKKNTSGIQDSRFTIPRKYVLIFLNLESRNLHFVLTKRN